MLLTRSFTGSLAIAISWTLSAAQAAAVAQTSIHHARQDDKIDTITQLETLLSIYHLPALAISAHTPDHGLRQAHAGVRQIKNTTNIITTNDTWHLGSNTKAMTATTLALLIQDGLLSWNTTLSDVFEGKLLANITVHPLLANVTIAEVAAHRSGLMGTVGIDNPALLPGKMLEIYALDAPIGRAVAGATILGIPPTGKRGKYEYANNNYILLGLVIDAVTEIAAEEVIANRLWEPLEMETAVWGADLGTEVVQPWPHLLDVLTGVTYAYKEEWPALFRDYASYMNTAGRARMSLADYDKWLRLHVDEDVQAKVGLGKEQLEILRSAYGQEDDDDMAYSCGGWIVAVEGCSSESAVCLTHSGSNTMNYASAWIDTGLNATWATASNAPYEGGGMVGVETTMLLMLNGTIIP